MEDHHAARPDAALPGVDLLHRMLVAVRSVNEKDVNSRRDALVAAPLCKLLAPELHVVRFHEPPALLQIVWFFYCIPMMVDVFIDPVMMGVLALGLNLTAFNAEAYRAGVQAVPREHLDASVALGLKPWQRTVYVVLPQALRSSMPVLMTNGIGSLQQSALVAIVAVTDLMYVGKSLATEAYRPLETYTVVALIYFALSLPIAKLVHVIERRQDLAVQR